MADKSITSFKEFWPYYVAQHLDPKCRRLHFIGTTGVIGIAAMAPFVPPALLAAPVMGYGFAWAGHFLFEKNRPATFKYPLWSLAGDFVMYKKMITGEMKQEIERVKEMIENGEVDWADDAAVNAVA